MPCGANDKFVLLAGVLRVVTVASVLIRTLPVPFGLILRSVFVPVVVIVLLVPPINILPVPSGPIVKLPLLAGDPIVVTSNVLAVATITLPVPFGSKLICPFVSVEIIVLPLTLILSTVKVVNPATAPSKLTVIVSLNTIEKSDKIDLFGKQLSMHIAASNPIALNADQIDQEIINKEINLIEEELKNSGKPDDIAKKISSGKINKFKEENSLMSQDWVMEPKMKVADVVKSLEISNLNINNFIRLKIGE